MKEILKTLHENSDLKYNDFNTKIINTNQKTIGVRIPKLRQIAKQIAKTNADIFIQKDKQNIYELILLEGLVISYLKNPFENLSLYENFFKKVDSWAQIDATIIKYKNIDNLKLLQIAQKWLNSNEEFTIRAGILILIKNLIDKNFLNTIFKLSENINHKGYYVYMANSWLISECMAKFPQQTKTFLISNTLENKTQNQAILKSRQSYRVCQKDKDFLQTLKR